MPKSSRCPTDERRGVHSHPPAGKRVSFQSEEGEGVVLDVSDDETMPVEVARNSSPGRVFASQAVHGADFIIRTESGLDRIGGNR